jgi:hypothetical protein
MIAPPATRMTKMRTMANKPEIALLDLVAGSEFVSVRNSAFTRFHMNSNVYLMLVDQIT